MLHVYADDDYNVVTKLELPANNYPNWLIYWINQYVNFSHYLNKSESISNTEDSNIREWFGIASNSTHLGQR